MIDSPYVGPPHIKFPSYGPAVRAYVQVTSGRIADVSIFLKQN